MKLCKDCANFIHSTGACGRSVSAPDYVFGTPTKTINAQIEREFPSGCGPAALFFVPIPIAVNAYANAMVKREQIARHEGKPEHDLDVVGRVLRAGH